MGDLLKSLLPRVIQDLLTSGAAVLVAHGYLMASQSEAFVGSAFFLIMLVVNYSISQGRKADAATSGAAAVGGILAPSTAKAIAKGTHP